MPVMGKEEATNWEAASFLPSRADPRPRQLGKCNSPAEITNRFFWVFSLGHEVPTGGEDAGNILLDPYTTMGLAVEIGQGLLSLATVYKHTLSRKLSHLTPGYLPTRNENMCWS